MVYLQNAKTQRYSYIESWILSATSITGTSHVLTSKFDIHGRSIISLWITVICGVRFDSSRLTLVSRI